MKKKYSTVLICALIAPCLIGAKNTNLLSIDEKIIDFNTEIDFSDPGGTAFEDSSGDNIFHQVTTPPAETSAPTPKVTNVKVTEKAEEKKAVIKIEIRGTTVKYNSESIDEKELDNKIESDVNKDTEIKLIDDYADDGLYRKIKKKLKIYEKDGITITEDKR